MYTKILAKLACKFLSYYDQSKLTSHCIVVNSGKSIHMDIQDEIKNLEEVAKRLSRKILDISQQESFAANASNSIDTYKEGNQKLHLDVYAKYLELERIINELKALLQNR